MFGLTGTVSRHYFLKKYGYYLCSGVAVCLKRFKLSKKSYFPDLNIHLGSQVHIWKLLVCFAISVYLIFLVLWKTSSERLL